MIKEQVTRITVGVQPFDNLSEKTGFDHFVRGFTDDLITDLSRFGSLSIRRQTKNTSQTDSNDYLVQGSFRTYSDKVRITVQLVRSEDSSIIFADRYDKDFDALFHIQDDITRQIVNTIQQQINKNLVANSHRKPQTKIAAYDYLLKGMEELRKGTVESDLMAREYFNHALRIDEHYARAYTGLSLSYFNEWSCQLWNRWEVSKTGAKEFAQKAIEHDESEYEAHAVMGRVHLYDAEYEKAEHCLRRSMQLNPNDADNLVYLASCFCYLGLVEEAREIYQKAMLINPYKPDWYYSYGTLIYLELGDYEKSVAMGELLKLDDSWIDFPAYMAAAYYYLGKTEKMALAWKTYLGLFRNKIAHTQDASEEEAIHWFMNVNPYKGKTHLQGFWDYLRKENSLNIDMLVKDREYITPPANSFKQEGDLWQVCYAGSSVTLRDSKGLNNIAMLLTQPEKEIHCADLMGAAIIQEPGTEVIDNQARKAYEQKIKDLREELEEAEDMNDLEQASKLSEEYETLVAHLSKSLGLAGETRKMGSSVEKARSAVTLRIKSTIKKIDSVHPGLARHFLSAIKTGTFCSYKPEKEIDWLV